MTEPEDPRKSLLAPYKGEAPPRSQFLSEMLAHPAQESRFTCDGAEVEMLTWGEIGRPGLLLLHGNGAHAGWWRFIAPALAGEYRIAAISFSGMGRSDWRNAYSLEGFVAEMVGAVEAAGLDASGSKVQVVGHSFGGLPLVAAGCSHSDTFGSGILIDTFLPREDSSPPRWASSGQAPPVYAEIAQALARFRFAPLQETPNLDIVDLIARESLKEVEGGWTWRFDPQLWAKLDRSSALDCFRSVRIPLAVLYGERSALVDTEVVERMRSLVTHCPIHAAIPQAEHHVLVDQPVALIAAMKVALQALAGYGPTAKG